MPVSEISDIAVSNPEIVGEIQSNQRRLEIAAINGATSLTVDFNNLILRDNYGQEILLARQTADTALTISGSSTGAGGLDTGTMAISWYYIYIIFNKSTRTISGLLSTQYADKPTLPSGYNYYRRVGAVYNHVNGSAYFKGMKQFEDYVYYTYGMTSIVSSFTTGAWTSMTITNYVPRTAKTIRVCFAGNSIDSSGIAPVSSGFGGTYFKEKGESTGTSFDFGLFTARYNHITMECNLVRGSTTAYYFVNFDSGSTGEIWSLGYIDNIDLYY